ncbi:MAG: shikimate dehydrogenase [Candidatus Omnitrophota bacterium]
MDRKKTYGILGKKISYSLSPVMHNAAFRHFGIPGEYKIFDVAESELDGFFQSIVSDGAIRGINVTVPYKVKVKEMLEERDSFMGDDVKILGAVNTVKVDGQDLSGFNTDGRGFYEALMASPDLDPKGKDILVMGAGGAGRAICLYLALLCENTPKTIKVFDVDKRKLGHLKAFFDESDNPDIFRPVETPEDIPGAIKGCYMIVNATPLGTKEGDPMPVSPDLLREGMVVYDLVYARETELIKIAKEKSLTTVNGLGMLVNQGALAFNLWTQKPLTEIREVMAEALREELGWS